MKLSELYKPTLLLEWLRITYNLVEGSEEPSWPASWSDSLFVPRSTQELARSKRFLGWLLSHQIPVDQWFDRTENQPPAYVAGGVGRAYMIGQYVIKFTTDEKEAAFANALVGFKLPYLANFYDVAEVGGGGGTTKSGSIKRLFAIVQERLQTGVSKKYRVAGTAVYSYLDNFNEPIIDVDKAVELTTQKYLSAKYRRDPAVIKAVRNILFGLQKIYQETGIQLQDPHGANLAFKGSNIGFFDVGRSTRFKGSGAGGIKRL